MIHKEEFRCTEETALKLKEAYADSRVHFYIDPVAIALGIPVIVKEEVPEGKLQFWRDDVMIKEIDI